MNNGYALRKDIIRYSQAQCPVCNRIFPTTLDLISHFDSFHLNHQLSTYSSAVAAAAAASPANFRQYYPNVNRNPNPGFQARNRFDMNYYRKGYLDTQGRFHKGFPPAMTPAKRPNVMFGQQDKKPRLMEFFPETLPENFDGRTLPLIYQLEHQKPVKTVTGNGGVTSSSIDLTLRL